MRQDNTIYKFSIKLSFSTKGQNQSKDKTNQRTKQIKATETNKRNNETKRYTLLLNQVELSK